MQNIFGLKRRKGSVFSQFVKVTAILSMAIYVVSFVFSLYAIKRSDMYFTNEIRTYIAFGLLLPVILSLMIICFYEKLHPKHRFNTNTIISLFCFQLYLFIPLVLFVFRYINWIGVVSWLSVIFQIIGISILATIKKKTIKNIVFVYWEVWSPECKDIDNNHFNNQKQQEKEHLYTDMNTIKVFQENFVPHSREAELIKRCLNNGTNQFNISATNISMLDIGGYNGSFTAKLIRELNLNIGNIEVVEPINVETEYRQNLSSVSSIQFINKGLEKYTTIKKFGVVLASHSLYSCIDNNKFTNNGDIVSKLLSFINDNGLIIVILGNAKGKAYSLKKELRRFILNDETENTNSNDFETMLKVQSGITYEKISIDNYIELENILNDDQTLKKWVSYFARVPIINDKHIEEGIKDLFKIFSVKYQNLPEETKRQYSQAREDVLLLSHKTDTFLIKKV